MLIPSAEIHARQLAIVGDRAPHQWTENDVRDLMEVDPEDFAVLLQSAELKIRAEEYQDAEEILWRAADLYPCTWAVYNGLTQLTGNNGQRDLSLALSMIDIFYLSRDPHAAERRVKSGEFRTMDPFIQKVAKNRKLSPLSQVELIARALSAVPESEPPEITEKLRGHRLIRDLFRFGDLDAELVNRILGSAEVATALLVGVLRGWVRRLHEDETAVRNATALLGEIADLSTLHTVIEIGSGNSDDLRQIAVWAFDRMKVKQGEAFDRAVLEIAADAGPEESMVLMKPATFYHRQWAASFPLLDLLAGRVGHYSQNDRDAIVPALVMTLMTVKGREGVEQSRKLLRENAAVLSRDVRSDCDGMIAELGSGPYPKLDPPGASKETVYSICAGLAPATQSEEDDIEFEDDFEPVVPRQRAVRPGRNDPCWCGSGRKYKKCHLDADEQGRSEAAPAQAGGGLARPEAQRLLRQLIAFKERELSASESRQLKAMLFEANDPETDPVLLGEWGLYDWVSPRFGRTFIQEYLRRNHAHLSQGEQDLLRNWAESYYGLHEVTDIRKGSGLTLKDIATGESRFVHDVSMSKALVRWDGVLARVVNGDRGHELGGFALVVPRKLLNPLHAWMEKEKRRLRLPWNEYLKSQFPQIRRQLHRALREGLAGLQIQNSDGEPITISTSIYGIEDVDGLLAALRRTPEIVEDTNGKVYSWLSSKRTVLGTIFIDGPQLKIECNSKARLGRGNELLAAIAGNAIRHKSDEYVDQNELKGRAFSAAGPAERPEKSVLDETAHQMLTDYLKQHYAAWPDQKIAALDNRTPREAMQDRLLRPRVIEILRDLENGEERKRLNGEPFFDLRPLQEELGVKEHER